MTLNNFNSIETITGRNGVPLFVNFSNSYFIGRLYIEQTQEQIPTVSQGMLETIQEQLQPEASITKTDRPVIFKIGNTHITAAGDSQTPSHTVSVPQKILDRTSIQNTPKLEQIWLAKPSPSSI